MKEKRQKAILVLVVNDAKKFYVYGYNTEVCTNISECLITLLRQIYGFRPDLRSFYIFTADIPDVELLSKDGYSLGRIRGYKKLRDLEKNLYELSPEGSPPNFLVFETIQDYLTENSKSTNINLIYRWEQRVN